MPLRLRAADVAIWRGDIPVVDGVTFDVDAGHALIIRGPNGAGKSTLLRALLGFGPIVGGRLVLEGGADDCEIAQQAHSLGHLNAVNAALTVRENLVFLNRFLNGPPEAVEVALARLNLEALADLATGLLSAGQKRRAGLARLLVANRPLWLLDEPTTSLDVASTQIVEDLVRGHLESGGIALIATHIDLAVTPARTLWLEHARVPEEETMAELGGGGPPA